MQTKLINRLFFEGIDYHHTGEKYIAFTLNGWKYVQIPIEYTKTFQSIINYLNF